MKVAENNGHVTATKKRTKKRAGAQEAPPLAAAVNDSELAGAAAEPNAAARPIPGVVQGEKIHLDGAFVLAAIGQKEVRTNTSNVGLAVAGQRMEFMNGGGSTFIAGQDVNLTNGGAGLMIAGRDVKVTNGGGGVLFAARDLHAGDPNAAIQVAGNRLDSDSKGGVLLAGNQVRVRGGFVGIVLAANTTFEGDARVLFDLSPQGIVNTLTGLVKAPVTLLRKLLPGGASSSTETVTGVADGESGAGI